MKINELKDSSGGIVQNMAETFKKVENTDKRLMDMGLGGLKEIQTMAQQHRLQSLLKHRFSPIILIPSARSQKYILLGEEAIIL